MNKEDTQSKILSVIVGESQKEIYYEVSLLLESYASTLRDISDVFILCSDIYDELYYDVVIKKKQIDQRLWDMIEIFSLPTNHKTKQELYRIFQNELDKSKKSAKEIV